MRKKGIWLLCSVLCLLLAFSGAGPVFAGDVLPTPHSFYGTVTIDGSPALPGTTIEASGPGVMTGVEGNPITTTVEGHYGSADPLVTGRVVVQGYIDEGATITFLVNGVEANETAYFHSGTTADELNLTVGEAPPIHYSLTVDSTDGGLVSDPGEGAFPGYDAGTAVALLADPDTGYQFVNWTGDTGDIAGVNDASTTITMNGDYSITANFALIGTTYNLTVASTDGGSVTTPGEDTFTYDPGAEVPLLADPDTGYQFVNWTGDVGTVADVSVASTTITMDGDYSITANFALIGITYDLTVASTDGGSVTTPGEDTFTYDPGAEVALLADPDTGYQFVNWTGDTGDIAGVNDASTTITMNGDYSITANFAETVTFVYTFGLVPGWNIISMPIALDASMDTWEEFSAGLDVDPLATTYYFDSSNQIWGQVGADYQLEPCDAIYVKMTSEDTVSIIASSLPSVPSKRLYAGWNLVGLAYLPLAEGDLPGMKANEALISVVEVTGSLTGYVLVVSPQVNQPAWIYTGGDIDDWVGESPPDGWMTIGQGYWVFMLNDGTLAGFTFTPISLD